MRNTEQWEVSEWHINGNFTGFRLLRGSLQESTFEVHPKSFVYNCYRDNLADLKAQADNFQHILNGGAA